MQRGNIVFKDLFIFLRTVRDNTWSETTFSAGTYLWYIIYPQNRTVYLKSSKMQPPRPGLKH
jgi:hypothetical protein